MGKDQTNIEITDQETGEVFKIEATSLVSNIRDVLLSKRRQQTEATVWSKLSESQQQDEITAMQELSKTVVDAVVHRVAEKGLTCASVEIAKFAVDVEKGEVTITAKGFASDEMLSDLAHAKGKTAKITIVDARQFNEKSTLVKPEPDQSDMLPDAEMSGAEIPVSAADANAYLEQLGDGDDLHVEGDDSESEADSGYNFKAGVEAYKRGEDQDANPWGEGTVKRGFWDQGWSSEYDKYPEVR